MDCRHYYRATLKETNRAAKANALPVGTASRKRAENN
jgi:hypothetical protein